MCSDSTSRNKTLYGVENVITGEREVNGKVKGRFKRVDVYWVYGESPVFL